MINESARQEALQAMGLPVLLSRFQLPGAKPSVLLVPDATPEISVDSAATQHQAYVQPSEPSQALPATQNTDKPPVLDSESLAKTTMRSVSELFSTSAKSKRKTRAQVLQQVEADALHDSQQVNDKAVKKGDVNQDSNSGNNAELEIQTAVINYQHFCIQLDDLLVIIDPVQVNKIDDSLVMTFDDANQKMLVRFLHDIYTLTFNKKPTAITLNTFVWPPHKDLPNEVQQAQMAYSMEQSFLGELATAQAYQQILVFSEGYIDALFGANSKANESQPQHGVISSIHGKKTLHVPSVQSHWQQADFKLFLWQSLQQLLAYEVNEKTA